MKSNPLAILIAKSAVDKKGSMGKMDPPDWKALGQELLDAIKSGDPGKVGETFSRQAKLACDMEED
jgi:hypothetical protein